MRHQLLATRIALGYHGEDVLLSGFFVNIPDHFDALASTWWDPEGPMKTLHDINPTRMQYIQNHMTLEGKTVLDMGCGAGILTEALAQAGVKHLFGIDAAPALIQNARLHQKERKLSIHYVCQPIDAFALEYPEHFDAICALELLEHVPDPREILHAAASMLKPGGWVFLSTLDRTPQSFLGAIVIGEYLARWIPKNTHRYQDFIRPSELCDVLRTVGLKPIDISGLHYNPFTRKSRLGKHRGINYLVAARKEIL